MAENDGAIVFRGGAAFFDDAQDRPADGFRLADDPGLSATIDAPAGRGLAGARRRPPATLNRAQTSAPSVSGIIGMLPDGLGKVFTNASFSASQIGRSTDAVSFTWGENLTGGAGIATGFVMTPGGEALVAVKDRDGDPGTLHRSTGFNPATMDATSWSTVLTASTGGAHMDGRWCLTPRSVAPLESAAEGAIFVCEYDGDYAWMSADDGATWAVIFDLQAELPGATHVHAIAYDRFDDRVWITVGDTSFAAIYYTNRADIDGLNTPWTMLPGSNASAWQVTTVVPLATGVVFLSDTGVSGVFRAPRVGYRGYGALEVAVSLPGTGLIGAHAFQASDDAPCYLTFYQSGSGQTPRIIATTDGEHFATVHTDTATVTSGPGIHSIVGPDADGYLWGTRNLSGSGDIIRLSTTPDTAPVADWGSPVRRGLKAHSGPEELYASTSTNIADGTLYLVKVTAEQDAPVEPRNVRVYQVGAATSLTSWVFAVFDASGAQLGSTSASDAGSAASHRSNTVGSFALTKGAEYYIGILFKGTTGPSLARAAASAQVRMGLSGAALLWATGGTGLSAMPASITPGSNANLDIALWVGLY